MGENILSNGRKQPFQWAETTLPMGGNQNKRQDYSFLTAELKQFVSAFSLFAHVLSYFTSHLAIAK